MKNNGRTQVKHFASAEAFRAWLANNYARVSELWVGFYKTSADKKGAAYAEVLDEALCYGWIDGVRYAVDATSYKIRFTPRKPKSVWSLVNVRHVLRLKKLGKMAEPGLKAFTARQRHRTGIYSFEQKRPGLSASTRKCFARTLAPGSFSQSKRRRTREPPDIGSAAPSRKILSCDGWRR